MLNKLLCLVSLPTWVVARLLCPLTYERHPWHNEKFSLEKWAHGSTLVTRAFDVLLWAWVFFVVALVLGI